MADVQPGEGGQRRPLYDRVWDFFCSLRVTLVILICLAAALVIGSIVPQANMTEAADMARIKDGIPPIVASFAEAFELFNVFSSYWFMLLVVLFALALTACSVDRLSGYWAMTFHPNKQVEARPVAGAPQGHVFPVGHLRPQDVHDALRKRSFRVEQSESQGVMHLFGQRQALARLNFYAIHAGLLILMAGAVIHARFGFSGFMQLSAGGDDASFVSIRDGDLRYQQPLGYSVRCEDFEFQQFADGSPMDYRSRLAIVEDGKVVARKVIQVNDPLAWRGITFYQSSYEEDERGARFRFAVTDRETGQTVAHVVRGGEAIEIGQVRFEATGWSDDFNGNGPAVELERSEPGQPTRTFMVLQAYPGFDLRNRNDRVGIDLLGRERSFVTGLQVASAPAMAVVWFGAGIVIFGMFVALFASLRRVWVRMGDGEVWVVGRAQKNQSVFARDVDDLVRDLRRLAQGDAPSGGST